MNVPSDIFEYRVFVTQDNTGLLNVSDITWEVDRIIQKEEEEAFYNYTFILESYHNGDLLDGQSYYVGIVPVNWLGQYDRLITWSENSVKVINDMMPPLPKIKGVDGESVNSEGKIRVTWTPTTLERFTQYEIYGQAFYFDDIEDAIKIATLTDISNDEYVVEDLSGNPITQENLYSFAVLVKDHNDHIDRVLDDNNTVHGVKYVAPDPTSIPSQIKGVSMTDVPNDGGSALTLSWFKSFTGSFWQYNIYFDDEPITDVTNMEPFSVIRSSSRTDTIIEEFDGEPLIDGVNYFAAVTIVDWNLLENEMIDDNNTAMAESVNQSDYTAPDIFPANLRIFGNITNTQFSLEWDPITMDQVIDFHNYLISVSGPKGIDKFIVADIESSFVTIDRLDRGTEYNINISIVDDNGNIGPGSSSIQVTTAGVNQHPEVEQIIVTVGEDLYYLQNNTDEIDVDLNEYSILYFTGEGKDDYTATTRLLFSWNITLPSGESIEKSSYQFDLDLSDSGKYDITLVVTDQEGLDSEEFMISINAKKQSTQTDTPWGLVIGAIIGAVVLAIIVVIFVLMSGSRSQKKQRLEEYRDRRKEIESMEPIYTNLPTWTCDCGSTQVPIIEHAYCNSCYQSHEAVPIDGIDEYLHEHDLVLGEMKIDVPPRWQGQDLAITDGDRDLEDRKKRALDSLNQEYAPWLRGTEYEDEIKDLISDEEGSGEDEEAPRTDIQHHTGAIIPGQMAPSGSPTQGMPPGQPGPIRPMVGGQGPPQMPMVGAPGQRPPMPQIGQQQRPPMPQAGQQQRPQGPPMVQQQQQRPIQPPQPGQRPPMPQVGQQQPRPNQPPKQE
jgi:hypothetical protein